MFIEEESRKKGSGIAWQNKDIAAKSLAERFRGKTFAVYGLDVPEIVDVLPTNLPEVEANELRLDNLFLLKDGSYAIVDHESVYAEENKVKYLGYVARLAKRLYNEFGCYQPLRVIIIYTADVEEKDTDPVLELGAFRLTVEEAFLSKLELSGEVLALRKKAEAGIALEDEDLMRLIVYPLTKKGDGSKQKAIGEVIRICDRITDNRAGRFVLKYLLTFTDKVISRENAEAIKRRMGMLSKVEQLYEDEKIQAVNEAVEKVQEEHRRQIFHIAENLIRTGLSPQKTSECTGLPLEDVRELAGSLA